MSVRKLSEGALETASNAIYNSITILHGVLGCSYNSPLRDGHASEIDAQLSHFEQSIRSTASVLAVINTHLASLSERLSEY